MPTSTSIVANKPHLNVTLTFVDDYDIAANLLLTLVESNNVLGIKSDATLYLRIKDALDSNRFNAIAHKFPSRLRRMRLRHTIFGPEIVEHSFKGRTTDLNVLMQKYVVAKKAVPFVRAIIKKELSYWKSHWGMTAKTNTEVKKKLGWGEEYELRNIQTLDDLRHLPETIDFLGRYLSQSWDAQLAKWEMEAAVKYEKRFNKTPANEGVASHGAEEKEIHKSSLFRSVHKKDFSKFKF
jgi:hypothetical protein